MTRPIPTRLYHFTHVRHLASIVSAGLLADSAVGTRLQHEAGSLSIKSQRRYREVPFPPGGVVSDYVPFYFAPSSPMMFAIRSGRVPEYGTDTSELIYLVTRAERLIELGHPPLFTRRNAALISAEFRNEISALDDHVDWALMRDQYWRDTDADGDRRARRMAEWLVHGRVGWEAFSGIAVHNDAVRLQAEATLATLGVSLPTLVKREWYF